MNNFFLIMQFTNKEKEVVLMKENCWEVKNCGREQNGANVVELGSCPAAINPHLDGVHGGKNGGRTCWVIAGTLCGGNIQGTFAAKEQNCLRCDFYKSIRDEEGVNFKLSGTLLKQLR